MPANAVQLLKRKEQVKTRRQVVENEWRECFRYTYPLRGAAFETMGTVATEAGTNAANAASRQADLLDSTGTDGARILASALMGGLTPANARWPGLEADDQTDEEQRWLDNAADVMWKNIHASNYDAVGYECMLDEVAAGMFAMFVDEDAEGGYRFEEWALANCYFAASKPGGAVDTVFNEFPLSAEQAVNDYGETMVSDQVRKLAAEKPDELVRFVRCVYPRQGPHGNLTRNLPFASVHIEDSTKHIVRESGYHENPLIVPRWNPIPSSVYAFGPAFEALPDLRTLNEEIRYVLANMDMAIAGMWGAVDDGVLNARSIKIGPRKVIVMSQKDNFFPLSPAGKFDASALEIDRLHRSIRKVLMADQLEPQQKAGTPPTATEVMIRVELIRQLLGPVYGRMQSEYLQGLIKRCFGIGYRAGAFGQPPRSLRDRLIRVKYFSPLARAQKATDVAAMDRYESSMLNKVVMLGKAGQPFEHVLDNYDWDKADRHRADLLGVPAELIPDEDVVAETRKARADKAQQGQMMQTAAAMAGAKEGGMPAAAGMMQ